MMTHSCGFIPLFLKYESCKPCSSPEDMIGNGYKCEPSFSRMVDIQSKTRKNLKGIHPGENFIYLHIESI